MGSGGLTVERCRNRKRRAVRRGRQCGSRGERAAVGGVVASAGRRRRAAASARRSGRGAADARRPIGGPRARAPNCAATAQPVWCWVFFLFYGTGILNETDRRGGPA